MNPPDSLESSLNNDHDHDHDHGQELFRLFNNRDEKKLASDVLDDVLLTPGVTIRLAKHGLCAANLSVLQNGIFSHKHNILKNWIVGESTESRAENERISSASGTIRIRPCTITIDPRDIEDARWSGISKYSLGFIVIATVSDDEGVHRCSTKIIATPESEKLVKRKPSKSDFSKFVTINKEKSNLTDSESVE